MIKTLIIIPAFNEEKNIEQVIGEVRKYDKKSDIVVVDDGSVDKTGERALKKGARVLRHCNNLGYGAALQTGFKYAVGNDYEYIVQMDGDGQHRAEFLPRLFAEIKKGKYDVVIGSRLLGDTGYKIPFQRRIGMVVFGKITSLIIGQKITDPTSGFRVLNGKVAKFYASSIYPTDFPDSDVVIMLKFAGAKIKEIPVKMRESTKKQSMHQGLKPVYYIFKMFFSIFLTLIREKGQL